MINVASEVAEYLEDSSIGTVGTNIFVDSLPEEDGTIVAVYNTGGSSPDIDLPIPAPSFQVLVRDETPSVAYAKIKSIVDLLEHTYNSTLVSGGNYYYSINLRGEIQNIGQDERNRKEYTVNFSCRVRGR
jgi:hypothetical protein